MPKRMTLLQNADAAAGVRVGVVNLVENYMVGWQYNLFFRFHALQSLNVSVCAFVCAGLCRVGGK